MVLFSGYRVVQEISGTEKMRIYRCLRSKDNLPVILKLLNDKAPQQEDIALLKHEYNLIKNLDFPGVIHSYGLEKHDDQYGLVLEDIKEGLPLNELISGVKITIDKFLSLSIQLAQALHDLHQAHIIHKDINPYNIIISKTNDAVKLINFNIATQLGNEVLNAKSPGELEGTLAYISPEQTSRMNRAVDERSDLYSLGVSLYEMATGRLPFNATDPMGWVHCHIAKQPESPQKIRPDFPEILAMIIMRLLSKTPEDRYASALGLKADLERCLFAWKMSRQIEIFPLGEKDRKSTFHIPEKLYGRETEVQLLLDAFERVSQRSRELLLVTGSPGIGKSSLVNEVHKPIIRQRGYFASGKCDQYNRIPYAILIQAFKNLIQQILTESEIRIGNWRDQLLNSLALNGQVIIDVIPELELLIGKQPSVPVLPLSESRNRFALVFFDFIRVFAKPEHPLVIYLDDLQWIDAASCQLLKNILRERQLDYFLAIGAYRDNEVGNDHLLMEMIDEIKKTDIKVSYIKLKQLDLQTTKQLITDTLNTEKNIDELAKLINDKTGGNPFFIKFFLNNLYQDHHIKFNEKDDRWEWNISELQALDVTDNIGELVVSKIKRLPKNTQELLQIAASIGNQFDLEMLSLIFKQSTMNIANNLWEPLQENLILPMNESYKLAMVHNNYDKQKVIYKFSHDRVQQAAYSMMSKEQHKKLDLIIGRILLDLASTNEKKAKIFDIANHFNNCADLLTDQDEKNKIAELNLKAGNKAKQYGDYYAAAKYFKSGIRLLEDPDWNKQQYDLFFNLKLGYAECQYSLVKFDEADKLIDELIQQTTTPADKAKIIMLQLLSYQMQAGDKKAVDLGCKGLKLLGVDAPRYPSNFRLAIEAIIIILRLHYKKPEDLAQLPLLTDPNKKLIFDFIQTMSTSLFSESPNLYALLSFYSLNYILNHGVATGPFAYLTFGVMLAGQFKNYDLAYRYGKLAINLVEKLNDERLTAITYASISLILAPWMIPYKECLDSLKFSNLKARQVGELVFANYTSSILPLMMLTTGSHLADINKQIQNSLDFAIYCNQPEVLGSFRAWPILIPVLQGEKNPEDLQEVVNNFLNNKTSFVQDVSFVVNGIITLIIAYILRDWRSALPLLIKTKKHLTPNVQAIFCMSEYFFYGTLTMLSIYHQATFWQKLRFRNEIKRGLKNFKLWTHNCPANFEARYYIMLSGVEAIIKKNMDKANNYYEKAIKVAREQEQIHLIAIANEFLAHAWLSHNQKTSAKSFLLEAIKSYQQWGAGAKVEAIKKEFAALIEPAELGIPLTQDIPKSTLVKYDLDLDTAIKSSHVISSRVKFEELLQTLIQIMIENAGAERGILLLLRNDSLWIEAESCTSLKNPLLLHHQPLEKRRDLSLSVIHYVQNTKEPVLLEDAAHIGSFTEDSYISNKNILSILCLPILRQGKLLGILYLENNLARGVFTPKRLEMLQLLATQVSISLENALLYSAYDQFVPHEFLDLLARRSIVDVRLGDHVQKYMTILFSDIRNFTNLSEKMTPTQVFTFMNEFLGYMEPIIKQHKGFIDKFIGDSIMALFPGEANDAVLTGIEMKKEIEKYNQIRLNRGEEPIDIGIGINSGSLILGTLGSGHRLETSVLSDAVNVASRIEELTKEFGCQLLISDEVYKQLNNDQRLESRFVGKIKIRGKENEVGIWEIFSAVPEKLRNIKFAIAPLYNEGIELFYRGNYQKALQNFQLCLKELSDDKVIKNYIFKCKNILRKHKKIF